MTIEQCYEAMGGDYADVCARIPSAKLIEKFVGKFADDPSFGELEGALARGDREAAFRAAHTLKGVSANMGFARLRASAGELTEVLRPASDQVPAGAAPLMEAVRADYGATMAAIREYMGA